MKRVAVAVVGALLAAGIVSNASYGANPAVRRAVRCAALTENVRALQSAVSSAPANSTEKAVLQALLARAQAKQAAACA